MGFFCFVVFVKVLVSGNVVLISVRVLWWVGFWVCLWVVGSASLTRVLGCVCFLVCLFG